MTSVCSVNKQKMTETENKAKLKLTSDPAIRKLQADNEQPSAIKNSSQSSLVNNNSQDDDIDVAKWKPMPVPGSVQLFSKQAQAPAPATSFYHLELHSLPEKLLILREWPRQRFSQRHTAALDPNTVSTTWKDFMQLGELEDKISYIFGEKTVQELKALINKHGASK